MKSRRAAVPGMHAWYTGARWTLHEIETRPVAKGRRPQTAKIAEWTFQKVTISK
jgi:hypothetical protein